MRFKPAGLSVMNFGSSLLLQITLPVAYGKDVDGLMQRHKAGAEYELKRLRQKRSLDANAYFWVLCDKIAAVLNTEKIQVYWMLIRRVGVFDTLCFENADAMERFKVNWRQNGLGWLTHTVDKDNFVLQAYYGSSRYSGPEMTRLIDEAIQEAKALEIETLPPDEIRKMTESWGC